MFQLLYKYLILNKRASLPGIGVFYIQRKPATLDFTNKVFLAPALQIHFKPETSVADSSIYTFISKEQKIDEAEAVSQYSIFANNLKENLTEHRVAELPGMGVLSQNAEGSVLFRQTLQLNDYFPAVAAERLLRENIENTILVGNTSRTNTQMKEMLVEDVQDSPRSKDYWWIFAIALGIIGIATIVYYYLQNGNLQ